MAADNYLCGNSNTTAMNNPTKFLPNENPVGELFDKFPELNATQIAKGLGINEGLMRQYISGIKHPSFERILEIENYIHKLGEELLNLHI